MKKTLKRPRRAEAVVIDGLRSYPAEMRELGSIERHEMGRRANNLDLMLNRRDHKVFHVLWVDAQTKSNVKLVAN
ncbi:hypothetical protein Aam_143_006 [Acidocella aminolytica 101 = DSM 11237]|uniref:Uncharacterized protein n=1 Tax=Acidocella aminolytica 101 = DSM 11237 TaxID=1120923 RepID=A0A0D6PKS3_9PROT|nr:hypothetical protein Aam_143_006 [Acidocella aminolytica 101 = DSM 11237]GBQ38200.1 hypothetical protein AA11237_1730 [Acidocella aminolytica 101 = DSM 11237]